MGIEPRETSSEGRRSGFIHLAVLVSYSLLTVAMTWPLMQYFTTAIPGDSFDGWQNYWNLWWIKRALVDLLDSPYYTSLLYYPTGVGLYFHTLNPFNGLSVLPVQLAVGLIPAYNTVVLLSWVLAGYGAFLLTLYGLSQHAVKRRLSPKAVYPAAFVAGAIFTFSPFHMAHLLGHMQVMSLEWVPFYLLYLLRGIGHSRAGDRWVRDGLMAGTFLVLTGLCDWYFVLYLFLFSGVVVLWFWVDTIWNRRQKDRADSTGKAEVQAVVSGMVAVVRPALVAGAAFALVMSPVLFPMVREALQYSFMVRPLSDLYILSASLMDFFVPNRLHPLLQPASLTWIGNQIAPVSERTISVGYLPILLAFVAAWRDRQRSALWLTAALFFLLLAMGPRLYLGNITWENIPQALEPSAALQGWTPFSVLNRAIPFMRISRSVSRYAMMVQLCIAVLAGLGLAQVLLFLHAKKWAYALSLAILAWIVAEFWVAPFPMSPPDTPAYYAQIEPGGGAILNLPMNYDRPGYLLYQTVHQRPLTVAYISRDDPRTLTERAPVLQHFRHLGRDILDVDPAVVGKTVLADLGVEQVVLDRYKMPGGYEREYTEMLAGRIFAGQTPLFEDDRLTVFAVDPAEAPQAYIVLGPLNWGPLREAGDGRLHRELGAGPAELIIRNAIAESELAIQYQTEPGIGVEVVSPDLGGEVSFLPPAPEGKRVLLPLDSLTGDGVSGVDEIHLYLEAEGAGTVFVESIGLESP